MFLENCKLLYLKSITVCTDHKRVKKIEMCCFITRTYFEESIDSTASLKTVSTPVVTIKTIIFLDASRPPTCPPNNSCSFSSISANRGWYELKDSKKIDS